MYYLTSSIFQTRFLRVFPIKFTQSIRKRLSERKEKTWKLTIFIAAMSIYSQVYLDLANICVCKNNSRKTLSFWISVCIRLPLRANKFRFLRWLMDKNPVSVLVLQNVHRGGQGQLGALYEISSFASSSPSPFAISFASSLSHQHQRPTTYRPLLRRDDQIQVVQAVEPLITGQAENAYTSVTDANYQEHYYRTADETSSTSSYRQPAVTRSRTPLAEPQNSYARLLHFQGDRRVDSFVRYWSRSDASETKLEVSCLICALIVF